MKTTIKIEKVSNMVMASYDTNDVIEAWDETEFTQRKLNNFVKRMNKNYSDGVEIIIAL